MNHLSKLLIPLICLSCSEYELTAKRPDVDPGTITECDFSPVEGTPIRAYDCNPVFTATNEDWTDGVGGWRCHRDAVLFIALYTLLDKIW